MPTSLARWHLLGLSSNAANRVNISFGCLASLTHENLGLRLLRLSERLEPNRPEPASCRQMSAHPKKLLQHYRSKADLSACMFYVSSSLNSEIEESSSLTQSPRPRAR